MQLGKVKNKRTHAVLKLDSLHRVQLLGAASFGPLKQSSPKSSQDWGENLSHMSTRGRYATDGPNNSFCAESFTFLLMVQITPSVQGGVVREPMYL